MRPYIQISAKDYREQFIKIGNKLVFDSMNKNDEFIVLDENKAMYTQLFYYLLGSQKFNGNLKRNILLIGNYGNGKTTLLKILGKIIENNSNKIIEFLSCQNLHTKIDEIEKYYKKSLILDEIGKEIFEVNDYGTKRSPIIELLGQRYLNNAFTLASANYTLETFNDKYGGYIGDRMGEMFNVFVVKGKSFRKE